MQHFSNYFVQILVLDPSATRVKGKDGPVGENPGDNCPPFPTSRAYMASIANMVSFCWLQNKSNQKFHNQNLQLSYWTFNFIRQNVKPYLERQIGAGAWLKFFQSFLFPATENCHLWDEKMQLFCLSRCKIALNIFHFPLISRLVCSLFTIRN